MKYRKRPVVIHARQFVKGQMHETAVWCGGHLIPGPEHGNGISHMIIDTREGPMRADPGDWVIRGVAGEFYPCKPGIFVETYDRVLELDLDDVDYADAITRGAQVPDDVTGAAAPDYTDAIAGGQLLEDEDGAPFPEVFAVRFDDGRIEVPYPGGRGTGTIDAARAVAEPNSHLGYEVVRCQLVPVPDQR